MLFGSIIKTVIVIASISSGASYFVIQSRAGYKETSDKSQEFVYKRIQNNISIDQELDDSYFNTRNSIGIHGNTKLLNAHPDASSDERFLDLWKKQLAFSKKHINEFEGNKEFHSLLLENNKSEDEQAKELANKCWSFYSNVSTDKKSGFKLEEKSGFFLGDVYEDIFFWRPLNMDESEYKSWKHKDFEKYWNAVYYGCGKGETIEEKKAFTKEYQGGLSDSHTYGRSQIVQFFEMVGKGIGGIWKSIFG